jgi:pimeloyl-ACP methyl ester carboxylesterase
VLPPTGGGRCTGEAQIDPIRGPLPWVPRGRGDSLSERSLVLVHGAGSGPWVFDLWRFPGAVAVDLQAGLEIDLAAMKDYAVRVADAISAAPGEVGVVGWSMGGLVAMMAAGTITPRALAVIEPSAPAEVQGWHPEVRLGRGRYDPEEAYGRFPVGMAARPESLRARSERKRGLSVPSVHCPLLVVHGADYPEERGSAVAAFYGAEELAFPGLTHFDLIRDAGVREAIVPWLAR